MSYTMGDRNVICLGLMQPHTLHLLFATAQKVSNASAIAQQP